ncbi:MAG: DNA starvation/stationary phase protection protein [Pseudomonadota bacterium]
MNMHTDSTPPLAARPKEVDPNLGIEHKKGIAGALAEVLADTYTLTVKSHAYHWNVVGPLFYSVHNLTEEHYNDMFAAADELAERIRALGGLAPMSMKTMAEQTEIGEASGSPSARDMIADLVDSHEKIARRLHRVIDVAGEAGDPVTEDLATTRSAFHEKAAWMLRAMIAEA